MSATPTEFTTGSGGEERTRRVAKLRLLWGNRKLVFRAVIAGALVSAGLVMLTVVGVPPPKKIPLTTALRPDVRVTRKITWPLMFHE